MSFIQAAFKDKPMLSRVAWSELFKKVIAEVGVPDPTGAFICTAMCAFQEAGASKGGARQIWVPGNRKDPCFAANPDAFPHDSESDDGYSSGPFQQQMSGPGVTPPWGWGGLWGDPEGTRKRMDPYESTKLFVTALKKAGYDASDPSTANDSVQKVQRSGVPDAYRQWWDEAHRLYDESDVAGGKRVGFQGDPVWLEDVLRAALGDRLVVDNPDWRERGVGGEMGDIWGVMIHHTGNDRETVELITNGRSDLAGPLSQCLITPDGKCHLIAVGPCNHAGIGSYPGIGSNNGNERLIGFECAWPKIKADGSYDKNQRWPDAQIITMRDATAAVLKFLEADHTHVIGHKEWATRAPNVKWDPGNIDMNWFRGEVKKDLDGFVFPGEGVPVPPPASGISIPSDFDKQTYLQVNGRHEALGWQTVVETLAELRDAVKGTHDAGKTAFKLGDKPK